jgi:hypothetical protein
MSRHTCVLANGATLTVGWDQPLNTFFGSVEPYADCGDDELLLWVGTSPGELLTVAELFARLGHYATHVEDLASILDDDRLNAQQGPAISLDMAAIHAAIARMSADATDDDRLRD